MYASSTEFVQGYPAMVNDVELTRHAIDSVKALLGEQSIAHLPTPQLGGEDFAFFSQRVPSLMFRLGVRNEVRGIVHGVHSSRFDLDEEALPIGTAALAQVAMDYVQRGDELTRAGAAGWGRLIAQSLPL